MSLLSIRQWKPRHLFAAWAAYWVGLVLVTLGPAIAAILRVTVPEGGKGSVSAGFGNGMFNLNVTNGAATVWSGNAPIIGIACALALPPLAFWIVWVASRPARTLDAPSSTRALADGRAERVSVRTQPSDMVVRPDAAKTDETRTDRN